MMMRCLLIPLIGLLGVFGMKGAEGSGGSGVSVVAMSYLEALQRDDLTTAISLATDEAKKGQVEAQFLLGLMHDLGAGVRIDHAAARRWLEQAATQKYAVAQLYLAWRFEKGFGEEKADPEAAARWKASVEGSPLVPPELERWIEFRKNVARPNFLRALQWMFDQIDNKVAEANLADVYLVSFWTTADTGQHVFWLKKAAGHGEASALEKLAIYQEYGIAGIPSDEAQAGKTLRLAAEAGSASAQFLTGRRFEAGDGVTADLTEAVRFYRLAVAQDYVPAFDRLVNLLRTGGSGLEKNYPEAVGVAERGWKLGDAKSAQHLGDMYYYGYGVELDMKKALELFHVAAKAGLSQSIAQIGYMYATGKIDGTVDYGKAREWYEKAAANEYPWAMRELGLLYENGQGCKKDSAKAFEWVEKAARSGNGQAQNHLGWMLRQGVGIERDDEEAVTWFYLASKNGYATGESNLGFHFMHGRGVERNPGEAFVHLSNALLVQESDWARSLLEELCGLPAKEDRAKVWKAFNETLMRPELVGSSGPLADILLDLCRRADRKNVTAQAERFVQQMFEAKRPGSLPILAGYAFTGTFMTYDLQKARELARAIPDDNERECINAVIESLAAPTIEEQNNARRKLRQLADGGHRRAVLAMVERSALGEGTQYDPEGALKYANSILSPSQPKYKSFPELCQKMKIPAKPLREAPPADKVRSKTIPNVASLQPAVESRSEPNYPNELKISGMSGSALVEFVVDCEGWVRDPVVIKSTHPLFSAASEAAILRWRFKPGIKNGKTVNARMQQLFAFNITGDIATEDQPNTDN